MSNKLLQDNEGNTSSKRIAGFVSGGAGLALLITVGVVSMFKVIEDPSTTMEAGKTLLYVAAGLLGIGVVEKLGTK